MGGEQRDHPFRELRRRPHITFRLDSAADAAGGALYARRGDRAIILVSPDLHPHVRSSLLAHELVHEDLGVMPPEATEATMERIEYIVDQRVAAWLVPAERLGTFVDQRVQVEPVTAHLVADEFGVSEDVARDALVALARRRASQHPAR